MTSRSSLQDISCKSDTRRSLRHPLLGHGEVVVDLDSFSDARESGCCIACVETY